MKSRVDVGTIAAFIAGGGLAGAALGLSQLFPHQAATINSLALLVVSVAGLIRTIANPTPTNSIQVFDRNTGSTVEMKTVAAPATEPASAPVYAKGTP